MDRELLLEVGVEEMPAAWLPDLTAQMAARIAARLTEAALPVTMPVEAHATPRRLTACVSALVDRQEDRDETVMGTMRTREIRFRSSWRAWLPGKSATVSKLRVRISGLPRSD